MGRQWVITGKYPIRNVLGEITSITVHLSSTSDGYAQFSEDLKGDLSLMSDEDIIEMAKEQYFKKEYTDRAVSEAIVKVNELDNEILKIKKLGSDLSTFIDEVKSRADSLEYDVRESEKYRNDSFKKILEQVDNNSNNIDVINSTLNEFMTTVFELLGGEANGE